MQQPDLFGDGRPARDAGMNQAAENRPAILKRAQELAVSIALRRVSRTVDADDVYRALIREGYDTATLGNAAGSIFRSKIWEYAERKKSVRISNHSRWIMVWRLRHDGAQLPLAGAKSDG